jgi:hypothetical protein
MIDDVVEIRSISEYLKYVDIQLRTRRFTRKQKDSLKSLILTAFQHGTDLERRGTLLIDEKLERELESLTKF